eukprot:gene11544-12737_t
MPSFNVEIESLDGKARENLEITGLEMENLTTVLRPDLRKLKTKYKHTKDKQLYLTDHGKQTIHMILGDKTFCSIKAEKIYKGEKDEPIVQDTNFGWVIHEGDNDNVNCLFTRESNDYETLYSLDVFGGEDTGENDQLDVMMEFKENITRQEEGRYNVNVPSIPGMQLTEINETQSRKRLQNVERMMRGNEKLKAEYVEVVESQLRDGVIEKVPSELQGQKRSIAAKYLGHYESQDMTNPIRILGHIWDKKEDTLTIHINEDVGDGPITKNAILSQLDPLGIISPTVVQGKRIFREACGEGKGWNNEVPKPLVKDYLKWWRQLREIKIPRSLIKEGKKVKAVQLQIFADGSDKACSSVTIAIIKQGSDTVKGLLVSKSRISKRNTSMPGLELVGGQMAANMARNVL